MKLAFKIFAFMSLIGLIAVSSVGAIEEPQTTDSKPQTTDPGQRKFQILKPKSQINSKFKIFKFQTRFDRWNFSHCNLF